MAFPTGLSRLIQRISKSLYQTGENTLEVYNGVKPQALYLYNTRTDAANWERFSLAWSGNVLTLGTEKSGSGTVRTISVPNTNFSFPTQNTSFTASNGLGLYASNGSISIGATSSTPWGFSGRSFGAGAVGSSVWTIRGYDATGGNQAISPLLLRGGNANGGETNATYTNGADLQLQGGAGSSGFSGVANGGNVVIAGGAGYGTGVKGIVTASRLRADGFATAISNKTANYTSTPDDGTLTFDATSGALVNTLETAVGANGRVKVIVKIDASANTVTIDPNAAETVNGAATLVLSAQWDKAIIQSDGANWIRIA